MSPTSATASPRGRGRRQRSTGWGRLDAAVAAAGVVAGGRPLWETPDERPATCCGTSTSAASGTPPPPPSPPCSPGPTRRAAASSPSPPPPASHGLFDLAGYNAAKHAVVGIVKGLAADLVGTGVTAVRRRPGLHPDTACSRATADLYDMHAVDDLAEHQLHPPADRPRRDRRHHRLLLLAATAPSSTAPSSSADGGFSP